MDLKEKDIVKQITKNWDNYFPELKFCKTEYKLKNFRVDILADFPANLKELGIREKDFYCKPAVFFEVKYNSNMRDLIFELQKQIQFRNWYINIAKSFCIICVLSDEFDDDMVKFMQDNSIIMYKYMIKEKDIKTLTIEEFKYKEIDMGDKNYES